MSEANGKELVLGNKQLLSIFFIVIAIMGVAFTAGYIIGRSSGTVSASGSRGSAAVQVDTDSVAPSNPAPSSANVVPAPQPIPSRTAASQERVNGTHAAKPYASDIAAQTPAAEEPKKEAPAASASPASESTATSGRYLQVAAVKKEDAEHFVAVLKQHGFPALLGESPKPELLRVLVGPFNSMTDLADAKTKLKSEGFGNTIIAR